MEELFLRFAAVILYVAAGIDLIIMAGLFISYAKNKKHLILYGAWMALGLLVFVLVTALGWLLNEGVLLYLISKASYGILGFTAPLLLIIIGYAMKGSDGMLRFLWLLTLALMIGGAVMGVLSPITFERVGSVVRYTHESGLFTWIYAGIVLALPALLVLCGFIMIFTQKNAKLFLGALLYCGGIAAAVFLKLPVPYYVFVYVAADTILLAFLLSYGAKLEKPKY